MVRIFRSANGDHAYSIQTTCLDVPSFLLDLADAISSALKGEDKDKEFVIAGALECAMPIAFKLSGYKAENVTEQRTLVCGSVLPSDSQLVASAGR